MCASLNFIRTPARENRRWERRHPCRQVGILRSSKLCRSLCPPLCRSALSTRFKDESLKNTIKHKRTQSDTKTRTQTKSPDFPHFPLKFIFGKPQWELPKNSCLNTNARNGIVNRCRRLI